MSRFAQTSPRMLWNKPNLANMQLRFCSDKLDSYKEPRSHTYLAKGYLLLLVDSIQHDYTG
ncbi:protein kinase [Histoplasma capsulatum G186AR]|nr:protein kinase [Histoplasma capsulatum]QSS67543.1 protein kinase [Histoplasma capsulatum G186AR]